MLSVSLACMALGGWVLVAPALPVKGAVVADPPLANLELPGASSALPAAPASAAATIVAAASPAASSASGEAADAAGPQVRDPRCGDDQAPVYEMPRPGLDGLVHVEAVKPDPDGVERHPPWEVKPGGPGYSGAMTRLDAALRASTDPFDRAMADWLDLPLITPPTMRQDALVHDALAVSDARVYGLAYASCNQFLPFVLPGQAPAPPQAPACAQLSAEAWARLDPGNAEPWLYALDRADASGDAAAQRAALAHLAESTRLDIHFHAGAAAVARQPMRDADLAAQSMSAEKALGLGLVPFHALTNRCRDFGGGDQAMAATCDRIAAVFHEHSDSYTGRAIGGSLHKLATGDATWLDRAHQEQHERAGFAVPQPDGRPCGAQRALLALFIRMNDMGEMSPASRPSQAASR
ncbi:MAG: hypothetical protein ACJ8G1_05940 [Vitreoscilla sp.]